MAITTNMGRPSRELSELSYLREFYHRVEGFVSGDTLDTINEDIERHLNKRVPKEYDLNDI